MNRFKLLATLIACWCSCTLAYGANRYWIGTADTDWSNINNWSNTSGGSTGYSIPTSSDDVVFDGNGNNNCVISGDTEIRFLFLNSGYTSTVSMATTSSLVIGFDFNMHSGTFTFSQGALSSTRRVEVNRNFTQSGGTINQDNYFNLAGTFSKTGGTFNTSAGAFVFLDGSSTQSVGATGGLTLEYVELNNSNGLSLTSALTVEVTFRMVSGDIDLNSNTLTIGINALNPGSLIHTSGLISDGTVIRWFDGTSYTSTANDEILFPFGSGSNDNSMWVGCTASFTGGSVTASFSAGYDNSTEISPTFIDNSITIDRRNNTAWTISANSITTSNNITLIFRTGGITGISNFSEIRIVQSNSAAPGSHGTASGSEITRTGVDESTLNTSFYYGGNSATNKLPISLSAFNTYAKNMAVEIEWETQSEVNNDRFEIQRSTNGADFITIGEVSGAGTSIDALKYYYTDRDAIFLGVDKIYYRLKQVDFDGTSSFSKVNLVSLNENLSIEWFTNQEQDYIILSDPSLNVIIYDLNGRQVIVNTDNNSQIDISALSPGTYVVSLIDKNGKAMKQDKLQKL